MDKHDPGLQKKRSGSFAGLRRIAVDGGMALWRVLTDKNEIKNGIENLGLQRKVEVAQFQESPLPHNDVADPILVASSARSTSSTVASMVAVAGIAITGTDRGTW